jgi:hypothetical protein
MANPITVTAIKGRMLIQQTLTEDQEALISSIAGSVLGVMEARLGRRLSVHDYVEAYDGNDRRTLYLRNDPVVEVVSITRDGAPVRFDAAPSYPPPTVSLLDGMALMLNDGSTWSEGLSNIVVSYKAGWAAPPVDLIDAGCLWTVEQFQTGRRFPTAPDRNASLNDRGVGIPPYVAMAIETHKRDALWA